VSDQSTGRMLLSHNFNLRNNELPALEREKFAQVFIDELQGKDSIECSLIENPHWVVEILFPTDKFEPKEIGQMCGEILTSKRKSQQSDSKFTTDTLILGGKKTTPATSMSPTSLQIGEWGVDVVETIAAKIFLQEIAWSKMTADKPGDSIFKIEFLQE
jgi:Protein of unknown function (DUF2656)